MMSAVVQESAVEFDYQWTIENFFLLNPCSITVIESPEFEIPTFSGTKWIVGCYPTGKLKENVLSAFLKRSNDNGPPTISMRFSLSSIYPKCVTNTPINIYTFGEGHIWSSIIKLEKLNYPVKLSLQCKFFSSDEENYIRLGEKKDMLNLSQDLRKLLADETLYDIVLESYNQELKAHKCVLWSRCPELLENENSQKHSDSQIEIKVQPDELNIEMQPHELKTLLQDIYSGQLDSFKSDKPLCTAVLKYERSLCERLNTMPLLLSVQSHVQLFSASYQLSIVQFSQMSYTNKVFSPLLYINANGLSQWRLSAFLVNDQGLEKVVICIRCVSAEVSNSVYLHYKIEMINNKDKVLADYSISSCHMFYTGQDYIVPLEIWKATMLKEIFDYLPNDTLSFKCELSVTNGRVSCSHKKSQSKSMPLQFDNFNYLSNDLYELYKSNKFSDVILVVRDIKFHAHKAILAARSPVFSRMFQANMTESITNVVEIKDAEPNTVTLLLEYIYTGKVKVPNIIYVMQLYAAADKYEVLILKQTCASYLERKINNENVTEMLVLADTHHDIKFKKATQNFIYSNADIVLVMDEWKNLIERRIDLATEILHHLSVQYADKKKSLHPTSYFRSEISHSCGELVGPMSPPYKQRRFSPSSPPLRLRRFSPSPPMRREPPTPPSLMRPSRRISPVPIRHHRRVPWDPRGTIP